MKDDLWLEDQAALRRAAIQMVTPGGFIVYSVCSLQREEGPEVVAAVSGAARERGDLLSSRRCK